MNRCQSVTFATSDLGIRLNGKLILYLGCLANPKNGLNLVPSLLYYRDVVGNANADEDNSKEFLN